MSVKLKNNQYTTNDILYLSRVDGVAPDHEELKPQPPGTEAAVAAAAQPAINYEKFLEGVEINLKHLKADKMPPAHQHIVANKLNELAQQRISNVESKYTDLRRFFDKLGQLFLRSNWGFRTKGEWGTVIAKDLNEAELKKYTAVLQKAFKKDAEIKVQKWYAESIKSIKPGRSLKVLDASYSIELQRVIGNTNLELGQIQNGVNSLSGDEFRKLLMDTVFSHTERYVGEANLPERKHKLAFYKNLDDAKKKIFLEELLKREDFFAQAFDIVQGIQATDLPGDPGTHAMSKFITPEMVERFKQDPAKAVLELSKIPKRFDRDRFIQVFVGRVIKDYLDNDQFEKIKALDDSFAKKGIYLKTMIFESAAMDKLQAIKLKNPPSPF